MMALNQAQPRESAAGIAHLNGEVPRRNKTRSEVAEPLSLNALFIRINPTVWQGSPMKKAM